MNVGNGDESGNETGLPEIIQMCCQSNRSGQVTYSANDKNGVIFFQYGQVIHAAANALEGPEAVFHMLVWPAGTYSYNEGVLPNKRTVTLTWEQLLFEGAMRADQGEHASHTPHMPTVSSEPLVGTRIQGGQPRITVLEGDEPGRSLEITNEYTHVGRVENNDIIFPYVEVSSRHCMLITSGTDIVLRDLNSSNGTYVNGERITEVILQLGDIIRVGPVVLKFESAVKRPKLRPVGVKETDSEAPFHTKTAPLPKKVTDQIKTDATYVTGNRAIVYSDLQKPDAEKKKTNPLVVILMVSMIIIIGGAGYVLFFLK